MTNHLCNYGFTRNYTRWTYHGEANRMRDEVVRQRIEEHDADAGVADMTLLRQGVGNESPDFISWFKQKVMSNSAHL